MLLWLNDYIKNRKQKVKVKDCLSESGELKGGVPQGSVLGPLLFLLYINDIADNTRSLCRLFADDTSLSYSSSDMNEIETSLNYDLNELYNWSEKWLVDFNPQKTECVLFTNSRNLIKPNIIFNNENVQFVENHKHLGVTFSSNINWNCHVQNIIKSATSQLSVLRKFKFILNRHNLEKIYFTYILPVLEYACELWDGCGQSNMNKIEQVQHEAARIVTGLPRYCSIESLYFETGWEPLHSRRQRRKLHLFYKIHNNIAPSYLNDCLSTFLNDNNAYNLRHRSDYRVPFSRLQSYSISFFPSSVNQWNSLDVNVRESPTISAFKRLIKSRVDPWKPPSYYFIGDRFFNIIHTRIRHRSSSLNGDLHRVNFTNDPGCACGWVIEDAIHYLLECCLYDEARTHLKNNLHFLEELKIETLLFGDDSLSDQMNLLIFKAVQLYIKQTKRFKNP